MNVDIADLGLSRPDLVAADLDGTLLPPDLVLSEETAPSIAAMQAAGVTFVICTGRMFRSVRKVAAQIGLTTGLVVCYQGAMVADLGTAERLEHHTMDGATAAEVVREARRLGRHLNAYIDDRLYVEEVDEWARRYAEYAEVGVNQVDDLAAAVEKRPPDQARAHDRALPTWSESCRACGAAGGDGSTSRARSRSTSSSLTPSSARAARCSGSATRAACDASARVACGDGMNDVDMLRWAGVGVAVAEAAPEVRAAADLVVPRAELPALFRSLAVAAAESLS